MPSSHLEIYAAKDTLVALQDPTKIRIMHFIQDDEKDFNSIVLYVGKAKSTVSSHLDSLEGEELLMSKKDPHDARKKIYKAISKLIGTSSRDRPIVYIMEPEYFKNVEE